MKIVSVGKTTPNVARAKARKKRIRAQKQAADELEAKALGITTSELRFRRAAKTREIITSRARLEAEMAQEAQEARVRRRTTWW